MKKTLICVILATVLTACDRTPSQVVQTQPQVIQPQVQPQVVQTQPQVVVVPQQQNTTGELLGAAALGAIAGRMTAPSAPSNTYVPPTVVHKTIINQAPQTTTQVTPAVKPAAPAPAPAPATFYKPSEKPSAMAARTTSSISTSSSYKPSRR